MKECIVNGTKYRLPGGLNKFQQEMYIHLINWKWLYITKDAGIYFYKGREYKYDAILPESKEDHSRLIYEGIQLELKKHHEKNPFRIHIHFNHMASSQAANINLFLPILKHSKINEILRAVKSDFNKLAVDQLDNGYCIEYWGGDIDKSGSKGILGDKNSATGTDSDIAIAYYNDREELCLWLIEHKLTEKEFTSCGGYNSKGRKEQHDCSNSFTAILKNKALCYYHDQCKYKYWEITEKNKNFFMNYSSEKDCPFRRGVNQLWRNQLLGLALEQEGKYKHVYFSVVRHPENKFLSKSIEEYKRLIDNNPKFSELTSADIISAVELYADAILLKWIKWYKGLYKL